MQDTVIVGEIEAGEAAKVRKSLEKAIKQVNDSTFDIAELLYTVKSKHLYTTPSFRTTSINSKSKGAGLNT